MMSRDTILFTLAICLVGVSSQVENFHALTNCVCPEEVVTYECTVCGGVVTVWGGNGFQCSSGEILIEHRNFITTGECNNGRIVARGIRVENGCYTSQLNVTFDAGLQDSSIVCSVDNGTYSRQVGSDTVLTTTESFRPPQRVDLIRVNTSEIAFSWTQAQENCSSISYAILSNNCGSCPNTTNSASASCFNFTVSTESEASITLCTFMVEVVVCSRSLAPVVGNSSIPAIVNLTVPTVNSLSSLPHYHVDNGLRRLTVNFSTVMSFVISDEIDGYASSYTITYSDSASGRICGLDTFLASNCTESICSRVFEISSSLCTPSSDINVTVSATTNIGDGPRSKPIKEEYKNNFVRVQVISTNINCTFLNSSNEDRKSCNATIIYGDNCQDQTELPGINEGDDVVLIKLTDFLERTMSSRYCSFIVSAAAGTRRLSVEGNDINVISLGDNRSSVVAAIVVSLVLVVVVIIAILFIVIMKIHGRKFSKTYVPPTEFIPPIFLVDKESNMIEFAKQKIRNYNPGCGKGYFELTADISPPVYISSKTQVVLINEDKTKTCTGSKAQEVIGFRDEQTPIEPPDLSGTNWKYVFIQTTSRLQKLPQGTHFMFYGKIDEFGKQKSSLSSVNQNVPRKVVDEKFYQIFGVAKECDVPKFVKGIPDLKLKYNSGLGYGFYEFTKPELISYDKQVILMGKDNKLYYGPDARHVIIAEHDYDESKEINPPNFKSDPNTKWKCAFVQTRSKVRVLQPHTHFLYCTVASTEIVKVTAQFKIFKVDEENEDKRKLIKFAKEKVPYYDPRAGYGYYEFTEPGYVLPERNVIAMKMVNNKEQLFTGPGVRQLIGAAEDYDGTYEISPPDLSDEDGDWKCVFIQGKAYGRKLILGTRFLYCEHDYNPEIY